MAHYRSPSPSHGRLQSHCNSRILEPTSDRRLHGATLATSPSLKNHPVRSSFELMKENDRESIYAGEVVTARPKSSPAASAAAAGKNGKNFMSPTISASSKAVGPSPRRKILGERNQDPSSVRSSVESIGSLARSSVESLPSMAPVVMPAKPALQDEANQEKIQKASGRREEATNHAPMGVDQTLNDPVADDPHTPASVIAPLDADPTLPPYDPETNFLSPRPRFLFYRPKPSQEMLESDHEEDQLSDDAPSDKSGEEDAPSDNKSGEEDADGQEKSEAHKSFDLSDSFEEVKEEEIAEKSGEAMASIDKPDVAAHEEAEADLSDKLQEEQQEEEAQVPTAASVDDYYPPLSVDDDAVVNESLLFPELTKPQSVATSAPPKPRSFFSRFKALPLVIIAALLLACCTIPLTNTPAMPSSFPSFPPFHSPAFKVIDNLHLRDYLRRAAEVADTNLRELASVLHHWSADAYAQLPGWALFTTQVEEDDRWFLPTNFTAALFDEEEDLDFLLGDRAQESIKDVMDGGAYSPEESEESGEEDFGGDVVGGLSVTAEAVKEEDGLTVEKVAAVMATAEEEVTVSEDSLESYGQVVDDGIYSEVMEEAGEFLGEGTTTDLPTPNHGEQGGGAAYPEETNAEPHPDQNFESPPTQVLDAGDSNDRLGVTEGVKEPSGSDAAAEFVRSLPEDGNKTVLAVSSFVVAVIAILVSFYYINQKRASPVAAPQAVPAALPDDTVHEASRTADQSPLPEQLLGRAGFETIHPEGRGSVLVKHSVETIAATTPVGESKVEAVKEEEESVRIQDARARRDSTASSTTSFGSFTTLEKVSGKKVRSSKDKDEAMTPVRRSSRIRSHK